LSNFKGITFIWQATNDSVNLMALKSLGQGSGIGIVDCHGRDTIIAWRILLFIVVSKFGLK